MYTFILSPQVLHNLLFVFMLFLHGAL